MRAERREPPVGTDGSQEGDWNRSSHRTLHAEEFLGKAIQPCGAEYFGIDLLLHVCARPLDHLGSHFPRPEIQDQEVDPSPPCGVCREDVTQPSTDGAFGFIRVGEEYLHVGHDPDLLSEWLEAREPWPAGTRPDPDEDVEPWHDAEEAAAEAEADRLTSDPDYMGRM